MSADSSHIYDAIFHHMVLPPKLPTANDGDDNDLLWQFGNRLRNSCAAFATMFPENAVWEILVSTINISRRMHNGYLGKSDLVTELDRLHKSSTPTWLVLHLDTQNAGILVHKNGPHSPVTFEAFEVLPPSRTVITTPHALSRDFPDHAVSMTLNDEDWKLFSETLATFLEDASSESFEQFSARATKAGKSIAEARDPPEPALVTEMLFSILDSLGQSVDPPKTHKRIRDDSVLDASPVPWRRSAYWLVLRVAAQRLLCTASSDGDACGRIRYKFLICRVLSDLLGDCVGRLHPEKTLVLLSKLCRRLAKLESERSCCPKESRHVYDALFAATSEGFRNTISDVKLKIGLAWDNYKRESIRQIPKLPHRAPKTDTRLRLTNSRSYLLSVLEKTPKLSIPALSYNLPSFDDSSISEMISLANKYYALADFEHNNKIGSANKLSLQTKVMTEASKLVTYMDSVGEAFHGDPLPVSRYLLRLFEFWVSMDQAATEECPLLANYRPMFAPEALDALCLLTRAEMDRLLLVQRYIANRVSRSKPDHGHIFDDPKTKNAFASKFLQLASGASLWEHGETISEASATAKKLRMEKLNELNKRYDTLTLSINSGVCACIKSSDSKQLVSRCNRCSQRRTRKKLKIAVHEDYLPSQQEHKSAVLLELAIPNYLYWYRIATWRLYLLGCHRIERNSPEPVMTLSTFIQLQPFWKSGNGGNHLTLASQKKSFLQTHYRELKLPKSTHEVLYPFGPCLSYYDTQTETWASDLPPRPSYRYMMGEVLPGYLPNPYADSDPLPGDKLHKPSSYDIVAMGLLCPPSISVHEFNAFQRIVSSRGRRWLVILVELASSNINFSSEATMRLLNHAALHVGPEMLTTGTLREAHATMDDVRFCQRLCEQLSKRIESLASSWSEVHCMSVILIITLRAYHLAPPSCKSGFQSILDTIRETTSLWLLHLRQAVRSSIDAEVARKGTSYALWAALLCRQTFSVCVDVSGDIPPEITAEGIKHFFRASIALQENLVRSLEQESGDVNKMLIRDLMMTHNMRYMIRGWLTSHHEILNQCIDEVWTNAGADGKRTYTSWRFLEPLASGWVASKVLADQGRKEQVVHYHLLQGHLLIDCKSFGKLPLQIRDDPAVKDMFENQFLLTCPSNTPGMQHQLISEVHGHEIHFGIHNGQVIIQAWIMGVLYQHIPRHVFRNKDNEARPPDLPTELIDDCVHWMKLKTGEVQFRRKPNIWRVSKPSMWVLHVHQSIAVRNRVMKYGKLQPGSRLVEPQSRTGIVISSVFEGFEDVRRLVIFQPMGERGTVSVEMKRLEVKFFVNQNKRLESKQLRAEVAPNQDIGTLYGLKSHIVLMHRSNSEKKSLLLPDGEFSWRAKGIHVTVDISNQGRYAQFSIDNILGRLQSPPDPKLLYLRAAIHALTSFPIPDRLTGRTGTEEALQCLTSARSQPWAPLQGPPRHYLLLLQSLSPKRQFYPPGIDAYQKVRWDKQLTMTIQHEAYDSIVRGILRQSQELETFHDKSTPNSNVEMMANFESTTMHPLSQRGFIRRLNYERICLSSDIVILKAVQEAEITWPGRSIQSFKGGRRVREVIMKLQGVLPAKVNMSEVATMLKDSGTVGGFNGPPAALEVRRLLNEDVPLGFGSYVAAMRSVGDIAFKYSVMFSLCMIAFGREDGNAMVSLLAAIAGHADLRTLEPPAHKYFLRFSQKETPANTALKSLVLISQPSYAKFFQEHLTKKARKQMRCLENEFATYQDEESEIIADYIVSVWPSIPASEQDFLGRMESLGVRYIVLDQAWKSLAPELERLAQNWELSSYLGKIEAVVTQHQPSRVNRAEAVRWTFHKTKYQDCIHQAQIGARYYLPTLAGSLVGKELPAIKEAYPKTVPEAEPPLLERFSHKGDLSNQSRHRLQQMDSLKDLAQTLKSSSSVVRQDYGTDLLSSINALVREKEAPKPRINPVSSNTIESQLASTKAELRDHETVLIAAFSQGDSGHLWLSHGNLWPCSSPVSMMELLRQNDAIPLSRSVKEGLVQYALAITKLQRLLRMQDAYLSSDLRRLESEQRYEGHTNWDPSEYPDWILLEIDNDILIRTSQVDVAKAVIYPASGKNSVLQLNMGEGKTSCILPMAVTALANGRSLCRLVVPKALLLQTSQIIQSRLGGLVGRRIQHIPFARRSPMRSTQLQLFEQIHKNMAQRGGVMICLPEHLLSFKMSGFQKLADRHTATAEQMVRIQSWLDRTCRDVLDESDFILSPKTQLIYPSGCALPLDGQPNRWRVVEELIALVHSHTTTLQQHFSSGIEVIDRNSAFPLIHILNEETENALMDLLLEDIREDRLSRFKFKEGIAAEIKDDVCAVLRGDEFDPRIWEAIEHCLADGIFGVKTLYLLRGIISQRILLLCLSKLWNVQYGLHPERAPMAVPFEAKGVPSTTSEYGHPDTAIILTYLAFYQTGLTCPQMVQSLQNVMLSDDPAARWERLTYESNLPVSLRNWSLININNDNQMDQLWDHVRFDRNILNYYMDSFVFPIYAKQFAMKLQSSGWDIPLDNTIYNASLTTGFSGTNDNKSLLPGTIKQDDLDTLLKTNAEVLGYLLEERNRICYTAINKSGQHLAEDKLLELLRDRGIKVLIDAGAYILEMENHAVAATWLATNKDANGAVYFDKDSRAMVQTRFQKLPMPLWLSPFAENLEHCVVYIDQRHTRGTDLKLPPKARGAVTLSLGQTKDQTVQAAMRMRQLGTTQSIAFIAPPEVYRSICHLRMITQPGNTSTVINSLDVVRWLLEQSCVANENLMGLHISQGVSYCQRMNAIHENPDFLTKGPAAIQLLDVIQEKEQKTLEELYGPGSQTSATTTFTSRLSRLNVYMSKLHRQKLQLAENTIQTTRLPALEEVEQEREFEFEVEEERERERPHGYIPLNFPGLNQALLSFVESGALGPGNNFIQAFKYVGRTTIGRRFSVTTTGSKLFVTKQFTETIEADHSQTETAIIRPVEWVLWAPETGIAVVLVPEEAELLIPTLRRTTSKVSLLCYAAPVTRSMQVFNRLDFYAVISRDSLPPVPTWLAVELCVLARGLYFEYIQYSPLLLWLGIQSETPSSTNLAYEAKRYHTKCKLVARQPLKFLLNWLTNSRQTQDILHTPMGFICQGKPLTKNHLFFSIAGASVATRKDLDDLGQGNTKYNTDIDSSSIDSEAESD